MELIDKQYLINAFGLSEKTRKYGGDHSGYNTLMIYEIQDIIESAPTIEEQKRGEFVPHEKSNVPYGLILSCSLCGFEALVNDAITWNFCPNCGADNREDKN